MTEANAYEALINEIVDRHISLSDGNQKIARYLVQNPNDAALLSLQKIAKRVGVPPSTLVRFAKMFGYKGFSDMQKVFETRLRTAAPGFSERVSALNRELGADALKGSTRILHEHVVADIASLQNLLQSVTEERINEAIMLLGKARTVHVIGQLRSYPVAFFLKYLFTMLGLDVRLLDSAGGLATEEAKLIDTDCVVFAISFMHYAHEVVKIAEESFLRGVPVISITDSQLSPLAKTSTVCFYVPEPHYRFSRSIAAPVCLANVLVYALAAKLRPLDKETPHISTVTERRNRQRKKG